MQKTLEAAKQRPADSEEDPSILEEFFIRGMAPKEAIVTAIDMLMAGIDTVSLKRRQRFFKIKETS